MASSTDAPARELVAAAPPDPWRPPGRGPARWLPAAATAVAVTGVVAVVLWQLHPGLLFTATTTTGGDTGAHVEMPALFGSFFPHLTGWDPGWYDGYPAYTYYFVLPDVLAAAASHLISYDVAFKLATVAGSVLLPVAAWGAGRLVGLRPPVPAALAAAMLPFLFDYTWTIYGGNLFSTLAGEYPYSLSVALALLFLGLYARGVRTGRHRPAAAVVLALCVLAHIVPALWALAGAALLSAVELLPVRLVDGDLRRAPGRGAWRTLWWSVSTVGLGLALSAWWLVPFALRQAYATSMNYTKVTDYAAILFPRADLWALALAGLAVVAAVVRRSRFALVVAALGGLSAAAVVLDPLRSLYNVRFLPLWFLSVYLLCGWAAGGVLAAGARWLRRERLARWVLDTLGSDGAEDAPSAPAPAPRPRPRAARWPAGAVAGPLVALAAALCVVVPPFVPALASSLPGIGVHPGADQVSVWSAWNYSGYQGKASYPEYRAIMSTMARVGRRYGCGRAMWEYNADQNRFGTPEALMLLPYWTTGCIDSMEGLLFESSATTPYHFLNQAELSVSPSEAVVGLPYGPLTVPLGVEHLQLLGVRYFMASSPQVQQAAAADRTLRLVATTGPWAATYDGQHLDTTWRVYLVARSALVQPLAADPAVLRGVGPGQTTWLGRIHAGATLVPGPALSWYLDPAAWRVELAAGGPPAWPRVTAATATRPPERPVRPVRVSNIRAGRSSLTFSVSRPGAPVLVKISYFPNWHAVGAEGPWRVSPNLMVVVPTARRVTLTYGTTAATTLGEIVSALALVVACASAGFALRRRRAPRVG